MNEQPATGYLYGFLLLVLVLALLVLARASSAARPVYLFGEPPTPPAGNQAGQFGRGSGKGSDN